MSHKEIELLRFDLKQIERRLQQFLQYSAGVLKQHGDLNKALEATARCFAVIGASAAIVASVKEIDDARAASMN